MSINDSRMIREKKTIQIMTQLFCSGNHRNHNGNLCLDCKDLLEYAISRLDKCPFQKNKPTCAECVIRCYNPDMRTKVKIVMRYSGPRMLLKHPILAIHHIIDGFKKI